ncbi:ABC transporter permease [Candidatus Saccharibacteria bacterium]|nr:ABC transporter permease [Candidatus Saccharibacteria bacterium]
MALLLRTHYRLARESIRKNRTRSFLTCLGIAVGVASIILIMSLMGSINNVISAQVKSMGADLIVIRPAQHVDAVESVIDGLTASNRYMTSNLTLTDAEVIAGLDSVAGVAPIAAGVATLRAEERTIPTANVIGTSTELARVQNLKLSNGIFLSDKVENSAVIGKALSLELFGTGTEAVGKTFAMGEEKFIVVGLLEETEDPINFNNVDFDNSVFVRADYLKRIGLNYQVQQIDVRAENTGALSKLSEEIGDLLNSAKNGDKNYEILYGDLISHPAGSMFMVVSSMLTVVAGVSLIVGGIGVMNILLVSVAERTREIGIRKAVGASSMNILMQFLFEAMILSVGGGLLGLILGYVIAFLISIVTPFAPFISWQILGVSVGTSVVIGILFGMYPAIKAARKNPIESLRYYR